MIVGGRGPVVACVRLMAAVFGRNDGSIGAHHHRRTCGHALVFGNTQTHGNTYYKAGKYNDAIARYAAAISKDPTVAAYRNNRAAAYMMLQVRCGLYLLL